jgi:PAS domain-containing protein
MRKFSAAALGRQTPGMLIAGGIVVVGAGVFVGTQSYAAVGKVREFYDVEVRGLQAAGGLAFQIQEGRRTVIYALTTDDPNQQLNYIDEARGAGESVAGFEKRLFESRLNDSSRRALAAFSTSWNAYVKIRDEIIASILLGDGKKGLALDLKQAHPAFERVKNDLTELQSQLDRSASIRLGYVTRTLYRTMIEVAGLLVAMLFFLKTVGASLERRRTVETLQKINDALEATQHDLLDRELRLRTLFDSVIDAIITIDQDGVIASANPATETLFGYQVAELIGNNVRMLMPSPHRESHDKYLRNYGETGNRKDYRHRPSSEWPA